MERAHRLSNCDYGKVQQLSLSLPLPSLPLACLLRGLGPQRSASLALREAPFGVERKARFPT